MAYSQDLRKRTIAAWQTGRSTRQLVARFDVSERTICLLKDVMKQASLSPNGPARAGQSRSRLLTKRGCGR